MKKTLITIAVVTFQMAAVAQTVNVHFKNGQTIKYPSSNVDYVDFSEKAPDPTVTAGAVVDLGLSVYWCSCNVGAESPEEFGDYFAWGETKTKSSFTKDNYSFFNSNDDQYIDIGTDIAGTEYDAATINLGSDWHMPNNDQINELINNCTWEWVEINNVKGYIITGNNGNSIFIPATGFYHLGNTLIYKGERNGVAFWGSNLESSMYAKRLGGNDTPYTVGQYRQSGLCIRPVTSNPNASGGPVDHSQDYLVTDKISAAFTGGAYTQINGKINGGSQLNVSFSNGSNEMVTLIGIQLNDASDNSEGSNLLESEVDVSAGETKNYTVTVGWAGLTTPVVRFTYRYNRKKYTIEATWNK